MNTYRLFHAAILGLLLCAPLGLTTSFVFGMTGTETPTTLGSIDEEPQDVVTETLDPFPVPMEELTQELLESVQSGTPPTENELLGNPVIASAWYNLPEKFRTIPINHYYTAGTFLLLATAGYAANLTAATMELKVSSPAAGHWDPKNFALAAGLWGAGYEALVQFYSKYYMGKINGKGHLTLFLSRTLIGAVPFTLGVAVCQYFSNIFPSSTFLIDGVGIPLRDGLLYTSTSHFLMRLANFYREPLSYNLDYNNKVKQSVNLWVTFSSCIAIYLKSMPLVAGAILATNAGVGFTLWSLKAVKPQATMRNNLTKIRASVNKLGLVKGLGAVCRNIFRTQPYEKVTTGTP